MPHDLLTHPCESLESMPFIQVVQKHVRPIQTMQKDLSLNYCWQRVQGLCFGLTYGQNLVWSNGSVGIIQEIVFEENQFPPSLPIAVIEFDSYSGSAIINSGFSDFTN